VSFWERSKNKGLESVIAVQLAFQTQFFYPRRQSRRLKMHEVDVAMEPIAFPITDELDLHTFRPSEVSDLLDDYFSECIARKIFSVRVIHGKGTGALKKRVQAILARHPLVAGYSDAPPEAGGWGATRVALAKEPNK
jgi:DNA-nicking Smr family endonuclease